MFSDIIYIDHKNFLLNSEAKSKLIEGQTLPNLSKLREKSSSETEAIREWTKAYADLKFDMEKGHYYVLTNGETLSKEQNHWRVESTIGREGVNFVGFSRGEGKFSL